MSKEKQNVLIPAIKYVSTLVSRPSDGTTYVHTYIHKKYFETRTYSTLSIDNAFHATCMLTPTIKYNSNGKRKNMALHLHAFRDSFPTKLILTLHFFTPRVFLFRILINKRL